MHQLILLRHAKAETGGSDLADHDRALTAKGRAVATEEGRNLRRAGLAPDVVLVSSARRTLQTLEALEAADLWEERPNIDILPNLYMATSNRIRDILRELPETVRSAMVIGHNPGIHEFARALSGPATTPDALNLNSRFPTAANAAFVITPPWRRLGLGAATLQRVSFPSVPA